MDDWLQKQLDHSKKTVSEWPQYMKDSLNFEEEDDDEIEVMR